MCKKDKTQVKQTYEIFSYIILIDWLVFYANFCNISAIYRGVNTYIHTTLFDGAWMAMNISYINMCTLKKNREWSKEWERGVDGGGVCGCSLGEPLKQQEAFQTKHVLNIISFCSFCYYTVYVSRIDLSSSCRIWSSIKTFLR